jgi:hypothetical protein
LQKNVQELSNECGDFAVVKRWNPNGKRAFENEEMKVFIKSEMLD